MATHGAEEELIPGLPEYILLGEVVPRLPWYTRPICRALSKSWRTLLDTRNPELDLQTRMIQLPLLRGLLLFCTFDKQIFISDNYIHEPKWINGYQIQSHWRKLPPVDGFVEPAPINTAMLASSGMVYVWSNKPWKETAGLESVYKLDMGCADWTWRKVLVPYGFSFKAVSFNGKIYVPNVPTTVSHSGKRVVLEHDMKTDICRQVETWNQSELRVVVRKGPHMNAGVEEMYGFEEEGFGKTLGVVMYDAVSDSWRTWEEVPNPVPPLTHLPDVELLNGDCFDPAPAAGINIVQCDMELDLFSFNSIEGSKWVDIDNYLEGRCIEYIAFSHGRLFIQVVHGTMYGLFYDTKKEGGLAGLFRRTIMKGRIVLESRSVVWEDVQEVGFFQDTYDQVGFFKTRMINLEGANKFYHIPTVCMYIST